MLVSSPALHRWRHAVFTTRRCAPADSGKVRRRTALHHSIRLQLVDVRGREVRTPSPPPSTGLFPVPQARRSVGGAQLACWRLRRSVGLGSSVISHGDYQTVHDRPPSRRSPHTTTTTAAATARHFLFGCFRSRRPPIFRGVPSRADRSHSHLEQCIAPGVGNAMKRSSHAIHRAPAAAAAAAVAGDG